MSIGVSLFLIALGAIVYFALEVDIAGLDEGAIGVILMIIGGLGLLLSLLFWSSFAPWGRAREERTVVRDREVL